MTREVVSLVCCLMAAGLTSVVMTRRNRRRFADHPERRPSRTRQLVVSIVFALLCLAIALIALSSGAAFVATVGAVATVIWLFAIGWVLTGHRL